MVRFEKPVVTQIICLIVVPKRTVYSSGRFIIIKTNCGTMPLGTDDMLESTSIGKMYVWVNKIARSDTVRRFRYTGAFANTRPTELNLDVR